MKLPVIFTTLFALLLPLFAGAVNLEAEQNRRADLARATTAIDSLRIMYDVFDAAPKARKVVLGRQIYALAKRLKQTDSQLEILRQLAATLSQSDSALNLIEREAMRYRPSDMMRQTLTYIKMHRIKNRAPVIDAKKRREAVAGIISRLGDIDLSTNDGLNQSLIDNFTALCYLKDDTPGDVLGQIIDKLETTMSKMPFILPALRIFIYRQAADGYTALRMDDMVVAYERKLLRAVEELETKSHGEGRDFRSLDYSRYSAYRRMLFAHSALSRPEMDDLFDKINHYASYDPDVAADMKNNGRAAIAYYCATNQWHKAVPMILEYYKKPGNEEFYRDMLRALVKGAATLGDVETEHAAAREYIRELESYLHERADVSSRELSIIYSVSDLREENARLEKDSALAEAKSHKFWIIAASILVPLLLVLIVGLYLNIRRSNRLRQDLEKTVKDLSAERDNVLRTQKELIATRDRAQAASRQKTDFINNMTHEIRTPLEAISDFSRLIADCADDKKHPYLNHYAHLIELNNELVQTMVNDVLDISEIDNSRLKIHTKPTEVNPLCNMAVENVRHLLKPGVTIAFTPPKSNEDITVHTDPKRLEQVLLNLLNNAAKFTREGHIELTYYIDGDNLVFAVSDTGSGIPVGKEEIIFERFEKLDSSTQGAGLGLSISRLLADMLKGSIKLDRSYSPGARFLFAIPLRY